MKIKRKHFIIALVFLSGILLLRYIYIHDKNYVSNEDMDEQRVESMKNLEEGAQLGEHEDISNGSYSGEEVLLTNRSEFISLFDKNNIDNGILVANTLPNNLMYINIINGDCTEENVDKYYKINEEVINKIFGIDNKDSFKRFYSDVKKVGSSFNEFEIKIDTVNDLGDSVTFDLILKGKENVTLKVKAVISNLDSMNVNFFIQ